MDELIIIYGSLTIAVYIIGRILDSIKLSFVFLSLCIPIVLVVILEYIFDIKYKRRKRKRIK